MNSKIAIVSLLLILAIIYLVIRYVNSLRRTKLPQTITGGGSVGGRGSSNETEHTRCKKSCSTNNCLNEYYKRMRKAIERADSSAKSKKILQYHHTSWCPYCVKFDPVWEQIKADPDLSEYMFLEKDQDEHNVVGIEHVPMLILHRPKGQPEKYRGRMVFEAVKAWLTN